MRRKPIIAFLGLLLLTASCGGDGEFIKKRDIPRDDFGTEVFKILRKELYYSKENRDKKVAVLDGNRDQTIDALNKMIEAPVRNTLQDALVAILPLYDNKSDGTPGEMPRVTRNLAKILGKLLDDTRTLEALAKLDQGKGAPPYATNRFMFRFLSYEKAVFPTLAKLFKEQEPVLMQLFIYLHHKLPTLEDQEQPVENSFLEDLLRVDSSVTSNEPAYSLLLDKKGNPRVTYLDGNPIAPFIDNDKDGAVDTNAAGDPIDATGKVIAIDTFSPEAGNGISRDKYGRAFVGLNTLYHYIDMKQTLLAMLLQNVGTIINRDYHLKLISVLDFVLGSRSTRKDAGGNYDAYNPDVNPILDLLYGLNKIRKYERLPQLLQVLAEVARQQPELLVGLVREIGRAKVIFSGSDSLTPNNTFFEEFHPYLELLAKNGMLEEALKALAKPESKGIPAALGNLIRYSELDLPFDMASLKTPSDLDQLAYKTQTDWTKSDDAIKNMSFLQQVNYLLYDTNHAPISIKLLNQYPLPIEVTDNMATFYLLAVAGQADMSQIPGAEILVKFVSELSSTKPPAEEMNLFINHDHDVLGNPVCNQGFEARNHFGPALIYLQRTGGLDALRPLVTTFVDKGKEQLLVDMISVMHTHYGSFVSTQAHNISYGTNIRATEPKLLKMVDETQMLSRVLELSTFLSTLKITFRGEQVEGVKELAAFVGFLVDTTNAPPTRDGRTWVHSSKCGADTFAVTATGELKLDNNFQRISVCTHRVEKPSLLLILFETLDEIDHRLERPLGDSVADNKRLLAKKEWEEIKLADVFLEIEAAELKNLTVKPLLLNLIPMLADRLSKEFYKPNYSADIDEGFSDITEFMTSRGFAAIVDLLRVIRDTTDYRDTINALLKRLFDSTQTADGDLFGALLTMLSDSIQFRVDCNAGRQLLRYLGSVCNPQERLLFLIVEAANEMYKLDTDKAMIELAKNLHREWQPGRFAIDALGKIIKQVHRLEPNASGTRTATDFKFIVQKMVDYLTDEERGLERMYTIIRGRN